MGEKRLSQWLRELDSHALYEPTQLAANLKEECGLAAKIKATGNGHAVLTWQQPARSPEDEPRPVAVNVVTVAFKRSAAGALETGDPKGAYFAEGIDESEYTVGGYEISADVARSLLGLNPGSMFMGRGSAHRYTCEQLAEAGY